MAVRIQLASNFQVVELTYDNWSEVNYQEVTDATEMVNGLGLAIKNDIKKPQNVKKEEELATPGQIEFLKKLGVKESEARKMTKKEAWQYIKDNK